MDRLTDSQLQELLDQQVRKQEKNELPDELSNDFLLYRRLFTELSAEPNYSLSYTFAPTVVRQVQQQALARSEARIVAFYGFSVLLVIVLVGILLSTAQPGVLTLAQQVVSRFGVPVLFTLFVFGLIQWADYYVLKRLRRLNS